MNPTSPVESTLSPRPGATPRLLRCLIAAAALAGSAAVTAEPGGGRMFERFDSDGSGELSSEEWAALPHRGGGDPAQRFNELDSDGSGTLSRDEIRAGRGGGGR